MSKRIMIVCGSPRKRGNTNTMAEWTAEAARAAGATVEVVDAARLEYKVNGCVACFGCQQKEAFECVIEDDATAVLSRMPAYDVIVVATPLYFLGPTAQVKMLLDRMYSLFKFDATTGAVRHPFRNVTLALLATAGGDSENSGLDLLAETYKRIADFIGSKYEMLLVPQAPVGLGAIKGREDLKAQAIAFGKLLCS